MARPGRQRSPIQRNLTKTRIGIDLVTHMEKSRRGAAKKEGRVFYEVVIEFNRDFPGGTSGAREFLLKAYLEYLSVPPDTDGARVAPPTIPPEQRELWTIFDLGADLHFQRSRWTESYLFGRLDKTAVGLLASWTLGAGRTPLVYKIWRDHPVRTCVYESFRTVKCDAAQSSFSASGKGIVWAIVDTGIDGTHPHFATLKTLELPEGLLHSDFTEEHANPQEASGAALRDLDGHGTHVAGIVAGRTSASLVEGEGQRVVVETSIRTSKGLTELQQIVHEGVISGLAPHCKLVSLKVLNHRDDGRMSNILAALGYVQQVNENGRSLKIHGVNISLGYNFDAEWFAAGQSPLCIEVDRLVRSGVVVVVAAGNAGYGTVTQDSGAPARAALIGTIMDPGNATLAITVGSTHRDMPHLYGVSYFSSKGPTSDGRMKPDLVAPGERIVSCALVDRRAPGVAPFREESGTSQAAPHVSGAIAAFLSVRREFRGQPERIKEVFLGAATDLKRRPEFQGAGLLDLMRTLQAV